MLKPTVSTPRPPLKIGDWLFDPVRCELVRGADHIPLPDLSARVLELLARNAPEPVAQDDLARQAWGAAHVSSDTIAQRITLLRKALGDSAYIRTVRGRGYALAVEAAPADNQKPAWLRQAVVSLVFVAVVSVITAMWVSSRSDVPAERVSPTTVEALLTRAGARLALQDPAATAQAIALLEEAQLRSPDDHRVQTSLAFALTTEATKFGGERVADAETLARSVIAADPGRSNAWHALGYALDAQGRIEEALAAYGEALRLDPDDAGARSSAAYLMTVRAQLYEALLMDIRAAETTSQSLYVDLQIARTLRLLDQTDLAERFEARARLLNPGHRVVHAGLAEAALARGQPDEALELINDAGGITATTQLARLAGRAYLSLGDAGAARTAFEAAGADALYERQALALLSGEIVDAPPPAGPINWPEHSVRNAERLTASGDIEGALEALAQAVSLGWRDDGAIIHSPLLTALAGEAQLLQILERIEREVTAQATRLDRDESVQARLAARASIQ
jgi:DNA-binding winged helix-turn-helix (wHTH) protein